MAEVLSEAVLALNSFGDPTDIADETLLLRKITIYEDGQVDIEDIVLEGVTEEIESEEGQEDIDKAQKLDSSEGRWVTIRGNRVFIRDKEVTAKNAIVSGVVAAAVIAAGVKFKAARGRLTAPRIRVVGNPDKVQMDLILKTWRGIPKGITDSVTELVIKEGAVSSFGRSAAGLFNSRSRKLYLSTGAHLRTERPIADTIKLITNHEVGHAVFQKRPLGFIEVVRRAAAGKMATINTPSKIHFGRISIKEGGVTTYAKQVFDVMNEKVSKVKDTTKPMMVRFRDDAFTNENFAEVYTIWVNRTAIPSLWNSIQRTHPETIQAFFRVLRNLNV